MPSNGEMNTKFGVYRNLCCGGEIVLSEGMTFPDCSNHPNLSTVWKPVGDEVIRHISDIVPPKTKDIA